MDFSVPEALRQYGSSRPELEEQEAGLSKNAARARQDRLAFSVNKPDVGNGSVPAAEPQLHYDPEPDAGYVTDHPRLARARDALQALVTQRIRELQFLTAWPLVRPRRTHTDVARLMAAAGQEGSGGEHWAALGMPSSPFNELPDLPELVRKDLYTSLDLLMALAGHLSLGQSPNTTPQGLSSLPAAAAKLQPNFNPQQPLPRSLAQISMLPALQTLRPPSLPWLRDFFVDLQPQQPQVGLDDRLYSWFRDGKVQIARGLVAEGDIAHCRSFARFGCPHGCRAGIWEAALGLSQGGSKKASQEEFKALISEACAQQMLADVWLCAEMASVHDSEHFFLFEDILKSVTLAFLRDHLISQNCSVQPHPTLSAPLDANAAASPACTAAAVAAATSRAARVQRKQGSTEEPTKDDARDATTCPYPPCGVLPPQGSILMAAPLCFVYGEPAAVYCMHRALYCRYWCKLHTLSAVGLPSPALPLLLRTYEELLQELDPKVVSHLYRLGIPAAAVALPWISKAFVGFMPVEEVLLLWDRVIGLDSLLPVALLAVAVVCFRRQVILSCQAGREVLDAMSDLSQLQTVPLLQAALFSG